MEHHHAFRDHTMQFSRLFLLIGIVFVVVGCGGGDVKVPPAPPVIPEQGDSAPAIPKEASNSRPTKKPRSGATGRPSTTTGDNDPNLLEWNQRLTALRKIRAGMTIEQVEGIIGIADETNDDNDPTGVLAERGETLTILTWRGDDPGDNGDFIKIGFINERLKNLKLIEVNAARK